MCGPGTRLIVLLLLTSGFLLTIAQNEVKPVPSKTRYDQGATWIFNATRFSDWNQPCVKATSTGPKCRIQFFDDFYHYNYVNATCIEDNVFLIKKENRRITRKCE